MKTKFLCVLFILSISTSGMFAHGSLCSWANCNQNNGNYGNNYQSFASAWCLAAYTQQIHRACMANTALANVQVANQASQQAQCGPNYGYLYGYTKKKICNKGAVSLSQFLSPEALAADDDEGYEEQIIKTGGINRDDPNMVIIRDLNGKVLNNFSDYASEITISVWKPADASDMTPTAANSIYTARMYYANGVMELKNFRTSDVILTYDATAHNAVIDLKVGDITIDLKKIDPNIDGNEYVVTINSDSYSIDATKAKLATAITEQKINDEAIAFNVFPNPANDQTTVTFKNNRVQNSSITKMYIFDVVGKLEREVNISEAQGGSVLIDTKTLPAGIYYMFIMDNTNERYCKKIIKN